MKMQSQIALILLQFCGLVFSSPLYGQTKSNNQSEILNVGYCDLLKNPEEYNNKIIRLRGIYRYGYEWSDIYCLDCSENGDIELKTGEMDEGSTKKSVRKKIEWSEKGRTVDVIVIGKFISGPTQFHMLIAKYFEYADIILKDSPSVLPNKLKPKANCSCRIPK